METLLTSIALGYLTYSIMKFQKPSTFKRGLEIFLSCPKCLAFWITLIFSQDIRLALLASLTALLLDCYIFTKL